MDNSEFVLIIGDFHIPNKAADLPSEFNELLVRIEFSVLQRIEIRFWEAEGAILGSFQHLLDCLDPFSVIVKLTLFRFEERLDMSCAPETLVTKRPWTNLKIWVIISWWWEVTATIWKVSLWPKVSPSTESILVSFTVTRSFHGEMRRVSNAIKGKWLLMCLFTAIRISSVSKPSKGSSLWTLVVPLVPSALSACEFSGFSKLFIPFIPKLGRNRIESQSESFF